MGPFSSLGKTLIILGALIIIIGVVISLAGKVPFLGKLPGDISYRKDNFHFYFPLTTSIVISVVASLILYIISRFFRH